MRQLRGKRRADRVEVQRLAAVVYGHLAALARLQSIAEALHRCTMQLQPVRKRVQWLDIFVEPDSLRELYLERPMYTAQGQLLSI